MSLNFAARGLHRRDTTIIPEATLLAWAHPKPPFRLFWHLYPGVFKHHPLRKLSVWCVTRGGKCGVGGSRGGENLVSTRPERGSKIIFVQYL